MNSVAVYWFTLIGFLLLLYPIQKILKLSVRYETLWFVGVMLLAYVVMSFYERIKNK